MTAREKHPRSAAAPGRRGFLAITVWLSACIALLAAPWAAGADSAIADAPVTPESILHPRGPDTGAGSGLAGRDSSGYGSQMVVLAFAVAGLGTWWWLRRRGLSSGGGGPAVAARLRIEESRSLGNRQYLVVASYSGRRYLLGVTQGGINMLATLEEGGVAE